MLHLHGDQSVEDDELDIVVALLHDQVDVATGGGLHCSRSRRQSDLKKTKSNPWLNKNRFNSKTKCFKIVKHYSASVNKIKYSGETTDIFYFSSDLVQLELR